MIKRDDDQDLTTTIFLFPTKIACASDPVVASQTTVKGKKQVLEVVVMSVSHQ
jgi:hypothetical protein